MLTDILDKIMTIFGVKQDSDAKGKKLIKDLKKNLKKNSKFFNTKKDEVTTNMAQFFYNIYRVVSPYADLLDNIDSSKELKNMIVENFMSDKQKTSVDRLSSEKITERLAKSKNVKIGASQIHKEIVSLVSSFSSDLTNEINNTYALVLVFKELACFNYYFMLKKFDSKLPNYDFVYKPNFTDISGSYISEDLKDFLEVLAKITISSNWKVIFGIFSNYRSNLSIDNKGWNKVLKSLGDVKKSFTLLHIVQVIDENPFYSVESRFDNSSIVEDYINSIRSDAEDSLKSVLRQKKDIAISKYVDLIFGDASVTERNKFYTKSANITYEKKELEGFKYVDPINFMRAYFLDYFKTEAKNVIEILLIQGQWATNVLSQELSEAFHQIQESLPKTIDLDNSLADDQPNGERIKAT
ncbi:MAG: hypothetical protein B6229_05115 [Spirochaetaceae bacterium 4572_7]|nr:MAG: hypothetical protein B6229_05115 [Spirochaetaceae bacterium 4572_7]